MVSTRFIWQAIVLMPCSFAMTADLCSAYLSTLQIFASLTTQAAPASVIPASTAIPSAQGIWHPAVAMAAITVTAAPTAFKRNLVSKLFHSAPTFLNKASRSCCLNLRPFFSMCLKTICCITHSPLAHHSLRSTLSTDC